MHAGAVYPAAAINLQQIEAGILRVRPMCAGRLPPACCSPQHQRPTHHHTCASYEAHAADACCVQDVPGATSRNLVRQAATAAAWVHQEPVPPARSGAS